MKKPVLLFFAGIITFSGCNEPVTNTVTYLVNEPLFMSTETFRKSVVVSPEPQSINNNGKMCFYEEYIFITETGKGIHIVNNSNPSQPQNVGFIELLGNADLVIRNGKLYADALIDLVWFDISDPTNPKLEGRLENVFSKYLPLPMTGNDYPIDYDLCYSTDAYKSVIVGWKVRKRTETVTQERDRWWRGGSSLYKESPISNVVSNTGSVGINSSMSRFSLYKDYLYSVINNNVSIIDLSGNKPKKVAEDVYISGNMAQIADSEKIISKNSHQTASN